METNKTEQTGEITDQDIFIAAKELCLLFIENKWAKSSDAAAVGAVDTALKMKGMIEISRANKIGAK